MCVPSHFQPSNTQMFAANSIEAISTTVQIPNVGNMQIALLYRSPSVPQAILITVLYRLLAHVSQFNTPCIILGDFNEDLLYQQNPPIKSNFSFVQLVKLPTTPQGTLLDHAFIHQYNS
jgi:hypothetical protein